MDKRVSSHPKSQNQMKSRAGMQNLALNSYRGKNLYKPGLPGLPKLFFVVVEENQSKDGRKDRWALRSRWRENSKLPKSSNKTEALSLIPGSHWVRMSALCWINHTSVSDHPYTPPLWSKHHKCCTPSFLDTLKWKTCSPSQILCVKHYWYLDELNFLKWALRTGCECSWEM